MLFVLVHQCSYYVLSRKMITKYTEAIFRNAAAECEIMVIKVTNIR